MNEAEWDMKNYADQGLGGCYRARWITPSEIYKILYILRKSNLSIALLFIQNNL